MNSKTERLGFDYNSSRWLFIHCHVCLLVNQGFKLSSYKSSLLPALQKSFLVLADKYFNLSFWQLLLDLCYYIFAEFIP